MAAKRFHVFDRTIGAVTSPELTEAKAKEFLAQLGGDHDRIIQAVDEDPPPPLEPADGDQDG